ncbi:hypothetical protein FKP32DRAFT_1734361, partial [Trametes sanguinea]
DHSSPVEPAVHHGPEAETFIPDDIFDIDLSIFESHNPDLYTIANLQHLETLIPDAIFPDTLLVHDPHQITNTREDTPLHRDAPVTYVRVLPGPTSTSTSADASQKGGRAAHLYLSSRRCLGSGHHSKVYRAPLELRLDPNAPTRSRVRVAVKVADAECGAHGMLWQEARMYNAFPKEFMADTVTQPESSESSHVVDGCASAAQGEASPSTTVKRSEVLPAIVPKFFGFYAPLLPNGEVFKETHQESCGDDGYCSVSDWPTPILLLEECGEPINPSRWDRQQREKVYKLYERLHDADFIQCSSYVRNMLVQPGPLSEPREQRSWDSPSFRIIDFGRGEALSLGCRNRWFETWMNDEKNRARRELRL